MDVERHISNEVEAVSRLFSLYLLEVEYTRQGDLERLLLIQNNIEQTEKAIEKWMGRKTLIACHNAAVMTFPMGSGAMRWKNEAHI